MHAVRAPNRVGSSARAARAAEQALVRLRSADRLWRDVRTAAGISDEWVSAFVLAHVDAETAGTSVAALAARQHGDGGWGYAAHVASDADSTAWAILALTRAGGPEARACRAAAGLLLEHQLPSGGFATYRAELRPRRAELRSTWFTAQPCVTATATRALLAAGCSAGDTTVRRAVGWLLQTAPRWRSTWWPEPGYPRHQVTLALREAQALTTEHASAVRAAASASLARAGPGLPGNFAVAQHVATLTAAGAEPTDPALAHGTNLLRATQDADGTWPSRPILRVPDDRPGIVRWTPDHRRVLTTAAALASLRETDW